MQLSVPYTLHTAPALIYARCNPFGFWHGHQQQLGFFKIIPSEEADNNPHLRTILTFFGVTFVIYTPFTTPPYLLSFPQDDCFAMRRNSTTHELYPDPERFPQGFQPLVEKAHALGLKFGIYTSAGDYTCHATKANCNGTCNVGSLGYYAQDAKTFASWDLDFIKMDWCSASVAKLSCQKQYGEMAAGLNATGQSV